MKTITLGGESYLTALVDDEDYGHLVQYAWNQTRSPYNSTFYARTTLVRGQSGIYMHRLILGATEAHVVDHIDGNGLNNQRSNLRLATISQNSANRRKQAGSSMYKGVSRDNAQNRWVAQIKVNGKKRKIGRYHTQEEAAMAYDNAAREAWGSEYARFNFPRPGERGIF